MDTFLTCLSLILSLNAIIVDNELDKDYDVFKKGNVWADAHIDEAADYMVRLYEDKEYYNTKVVNGQAYAREHLAYKRSADIVSERLRQIHSKS